MAEDTEIKRTKCPFYGFGYALGIFLDTKGNQCGLIRGSHSPCQMELRGEEVSWAGCRYNAPGISGLLNEVLEARISPDELMPEGEREWRGISCRDWYLHITEGQEIPRA